MSDSTFAEVDEFEEYLEHIGTKRHSGRYPWGSGDNPYQRNKNLMAMDRDLRKKGLSQVEIAKVMFGEEGTTKQLRDLKTIARQQIEAEDIAQAQKYQARGLSNKAIAERMGLRNESNVRALLAPSRIERNQILTTTTDMLKKHIGEDGVIDIGVGVEHYLGISNQKLKVAVTALKEEGYVERWVQNEQVGTGKSTNTKVLAAPGMTYPDILKKAANDEIKLPFSYSEDGGRSYKDIKPPVNLDSKRIGIRYGDEGGAAKDGVIELRRGVDDLSLNGKSYAQVRIAVDGTHYLKGMAMYSDNLPDGVDIMFNTNKSNTGNKKDAMKTMTGDDELPFGSVVRQTTYKGKDGKDYQSPLNRVGSVKRDENGNDISYSGEEGNWNTWSKTLSSQMLSKQNSSFAKQQLDLTYRIKKDEFDEILSYSNPEVKRKLLESFADGVDSSAVHLKAAELPRTRAQVILPINSLKDNEIYAPSFNNGEKVALIRHPHGGIFEIPELTVNNRNREALKVLKQSEDAVGINSKVAQRLSGADFDGDTVLVIPNSRKQIKTAPPLEGLKNFDPQASYKPYDGMKTIDGGTYNASTRKVEYGSKGPNSAGKQHQMGEISNLITDMTIKKASHDEIARAVRHSMVVIDAEKHSLDYKRSAQENKIAELKALYQEGPRGGASTLISRAKSEQRVDARKPRPFKEGGPIDRETGEKVYVPGGKSYINKAGQLVEPKKIKSTKMAEAKDAHSLVSKNGGTPIERVYADHANKLKALANQARKEQLTIKSSKVNNSAKETYANEVNSLKAKLNVAQKNAPLERKAQFAAKAQAALRTEGKPRLDAAEYKKVANQELEKARARLGAQKKKVTFTPREWEAIQAGAVTSNVLTKLLANADMDHVKVLATPRDRQGYDATLSRSLAFA